MTSSLVDFVFEARGFPFYSSVASYGQHVSASRATQQVLFELCSLDIVVRVVSEAWTQAAQFLHPLLKAGWLQAYE